MARPLPPTAERMQQIKARREELELSIQHLTDLRDRGLLGQPAYLTAVSPLEKEMKSLNDEIAF